MSAAPCFHFDEFVDEDHDHGRWVVSGAGHVLPITNRRTRSDDVEVAVESAPWKALVSSKSTLSTFGLEAFLQSRLKSIPEVSHVKVAKRISRGGDPVLHVWASLTRDDRPTRYKVYDVEIELAEHFPEVLFEFHSHLDRDAAPDGDTVVYERQAD